MEFLLLLALPLLGFVFGGGEDDDSEPQGPRNGSQGDDTLYGSDSPETLNGNPGDDFINGFGGNDLVNFGDGDDHGTGGGRRHSVWWRG